MSRFPQIHLSMLYQLQKASMAEKNGLDITKFIFQNMCVWQCGAVVKEFLALADGWGSTPGDDIFCFFVSFVFFKSVFFQSYFSFWPVFLYSYC